MLDKAAGPSDKLYDAKERHWNYLAKNLSTHPKRSEKLNKYLEKLGVGKTM